MGHPFDCIALAMRPVVGGVDVPGVASSVVRLVADAIHDRVAQLHVLVLHIDAGPQDAGPLSEFTIAHRAEQRQVVLGCAVSERTLDSRFAVSATLGRDGVGILIVDVGEPLLDEVFGPSVQLIEVVARVQRFIWFISQPTNVIDNRVNEFVVFGIGVCVVETKIAATVKLCGQPEVQGDRLGVSDVQVAVGFRWKPGDHMVDGTGGEFLAHEFAHEVVAACGAGVVIAHPNSMEAWVGFAVPPGLSVESGAMRALFDDTHDAFRDSFSSWVAKEIVPQYMDWERAGIAPREIFTSAGSNGFLGMQIPEEFGGGGVDDFRFNQVIAEEFSYAGIGGAGLGITLHNDITIPYYLELCTDEQRQRWLPGIVSGELITAIAMTEPATGSDLASIGTTAVRDGDEYVVNGSKTFITNGINSDLVIVAAKTDPSARHTGMTLFVAERGMEGFERGRNLEKIGNHSQDTAELFFDDVRIPVTNRLGDEGEAFRYLSSNLAQERLSIAITGVASAQAALNWTVEYVRERQAFGRPIGEFQNTKFVLAEVKTAVDVAQAFVDQCVLKLIDGTLSAAEAAQAKYWCTDLQKEAADRCLQLFGGYGYTVEYPIARNYADARVTSIYGGTNEIMKTIVSKSLGL